MSPDSGGRTVVAPTVAMLICELETFHAAHAEFNAAVIATARAAFPASPIHFLASGRHCAAVRIELDRHRIDRVGLIELSAPPAGNRHLTQLYWARTVRRIFRLCRKLDCSNLLVCGFGEQCHEHFALFSPRRFRGRWHGLVHRGTYLTLKKSRGLRERLREGAARLLTENRRSSLIVLGPTVARFITEHLAYPAVDVRWMHHPYLFDEEPQVRPLGPDRINFVFAGRTHREKGFDLFCQIASEVSSTRPKSAAEPIFTLAGGLRWVPREYSAAGSVRLAETASRLTRDDLAAHLRDASYLVMPYDASLYGRTKASGAFLDAVSYVKPIIALRTDEFSYYFALFGDLGILCDSAAEMKDAVLDIVRGPPSTAYAVQQANLLRARDLLRVESQKAAFRGLWP